MSKVLALLSELLLLMRVRMPVVRCVLR
jgi:hypothetical protein